MSMSNLLSDSGPSEPPPPPPPVAAPPARPSPEVPREPVKPYLAPHPAPIPEAYPAPVAQPAAPAVDNNNIKRERNGDVPPIAPPVTATTYPTGPPGLTIEATEAAFAEIESAEYSDVDAPGFEGPIVAWKSRSAKRMIEIEQKELGKRKV